MKKLFVLGLLVLVGCKKPTEETASFDKSELLVNVANNIILKSLSQFDVNLSSLQSSFETFKNDQSVSNLELVKENWKKTYSTWQTVKIFDFGPILNNGFKLSAGLFPSDTSQINSNISNGGYDLSTEANHDAVGLSSLDYLLFRPSAMADFSNDDYKLYTTEVIQKLVEDFAIVKSEWSTYKSTFISSTGTETTSSFSLMVNTFNKDYEIAKNAKLGIPLGKQSLGIQLPEYIEARYSGNSFELLRKSMVSLQGVYNGDYNSNSGSGIGFHEYLVSLERSELGNHINSKFNTIISKIDAFNFTLEEGMSTNEAELDDLYFNISELVVSLKTDMTSAFGVLITYQDNDGD